MNSVFGISLSLYPNPHVPTWWLWLSPTQLLFLLFFSLLLSAIRYHEWKYPFNIPTVQLHEISMPTWRQHGRDYPCEIYTSACVSIHVWERKKEGRDRDGVGELVGLCFVLSECLLQCSKRLSHCSPTCLLSLLGHAACIKMEGLHFCLPVHEWKSSTRSSRSAFFFFRHKTGNIYIYILLVNWYQY